MLPEAANAPKDTILIIDDSPDNLRVLSKTLEARGYVVRCVTNGEMAFTSIQNSPPNLILLDIRMPGMNGYEVCQKLKRQPECQEIPVIFLSALDDVQDIVKAFQVGGVDYITKPFQSEEVIARIQNQLTIQNLKHQLSLQNQHLLNEIEERKKFEQALCQEIQRRTLIEAALQDAKNAAEAANYAKSEFLSQMSHELRTPLNIIMGFAKLIQAETLPAQIHYQYLEAISVNAQKLLKMINSVLSIAHTESSQLTLNEQEFDLHHLLTSVVSLWKPRVLEQRLDFEFYRATNVPQYIRSDESKLRQILMQMLENSIKSTERGFIKIRVNAEEQSSSQVETLCNLIIEVEDTGKGTALSDIDTVFQLFSNSNPEQTMKQDLELGLLLMRQFAQLMGGHIVSKHSGEQGNLIQIELLVKLASISQSTNSANSDLHIVQSAPAEEILTPETLRETMPIGWVVELHRAAVQGFDQQILRLLDEIPDYHSSFAKTLEIWTRNFQFDRIIELTQIIT